MENATRSSLGSPNPIVLNPPIRPVNCMHFFVAAVCRQPVHTRGSTGGAHIHRSTSTTQSTPSPYTTTRPPTVQYTTPQTSRMERGSLVHIAARATHHKALGIGTWRRALGHQFLYPEVGCDQTCKGRLDLDWQVTVHKGKRYTHLHVSRQPLGKTSYRTHRQHLTIMSTTFILQMPEFHQQYQGCY